MIGKVILITLIVLLGLLVFVPLALSLAGVNIFQFGSVGGGPRQKSEAVLRSFDAGETWESIGGEGEDDPALPSSFLHLAFHPFDPQVIFLGSKGYGLWKSGDGGVHWRRIEDNNKVLLPRSDVSKIAISSSKPDVIYLVVYQDNKGRVLRSQDGGSSFQEVYFVPSDRYLVTDIFVNSADENNLRIITGQGGVLESQNGGKTWRILKWFTVPLLGMEVNKRNLREIFVTTGESVFKSVDGGQNWADLRAGITGVRDDEILTVDPSPSLSFFNYGETFVRILVADPNAFSRLYLGTMSGVLRSQDGGFSWEPFNILIPPEDLPVGAIALSPFSKDGIFVGASTQFYKSEDGGVSWSPKSLPTSSKIKSIFIQALNPQIMFVILDR